MNGQSIYLAAEHPNRFKFLPMDVIEIANETRVWAEQLYETEQNEDWSNGLCGLCAIASLELFRQLKKHGYEDIELVFLQNHVLISINDHYVERQSPRLWSRST